MRTQSVDTHQGAEQVQIALIRQASVPRRLSLMRSLSRGMMQLSRRGIERAHPGITDEEVDLLFVEYHYGAELALRLRAYLHNQKK